MPASALPSGPVPAASVPAARPDSRGAARPATGNVPADAGEFLQALLGAGVGEAGEPGLPPETAGTPGDASASVAPPESLVEGAPTPPPDPAALAEALRLAEGAAAPVAAPPVADAPRVSPPESATAAAPRVGIGDGEERRAPRAGEDPKRLANERGRGEEPVRRAAPEVPGVRASEEPPRRAPGADALPAGLEALARLHEAARPETPRAEPVRTAIATPVTSPAFAEAAAERVTWLVSRGIEQAEIAVTPPDLGPVEARIRIEGGEATIQIVAASAETRSALEQSLPRLAERLAESGLTLAGASVTADGGARQDRGAAPPRSRRDPVAGVEAAGETPPSRTALARAGLVDDFA